MLTSLQSLLVKQVFDLAQRFEERAKDYCSEPVIARPQYVSITPATGYVRCYIDIKFEGSISSMTTDNTRVRKVFQGTEFEFRFIQSSRLNEYCFAVIIQNQEVVDLVNYQVTIGQLRGEPFQTFGFYID